MDGRLGTDCNLRCGGHGVEPPVDLALEGERADRRIEVDQAGDFGGVGGGGVEKTLEGGGARPHAC